MKREDFKQIIQLRSFWKIDRRKGNYKLLNGTTLKDYILNLVESQMKLDNLMIMSNGNLCECSGGGWNTETKDFNDYISLFNEKEICLYDEMERRIKKLVKEIVG